MKAITIETQSDISDIVTIAEKDGKIYITIARLGNVLTVELSRFEAKIVKEIVQDIVWELENKDSKE